MQHLVRKSHAFRFTRFRLYADIEGYDNPATLFRSRQQNITATGPQEHSFLHRARPDVVIEIRDEIIVIELTCPFELNARKSREYKETRYKEIQSELLTPKLRFSLILLEVTPGSYFFRLCNRKCETIQKLLESY